MEWRGFECIDFTFEGQPAKVVFPKEQRENPTLILKTEYFDAFPEAEIALLERGYTLGYIKNTHRWGAPEDVERKARFVEFVTKEYHLAPKCVPVGMSCGGMFAIKLAAAHPELVACMFLDAAVVNYMSCPCGFGISRRKEEEKASVIKEFMDAFRMDNIADLMVYRDSPYDHIPELVQARIPVIFCTGDNDGIVPYRENGYYLEKAYQEAGIEFELHVKPGGDHHPHGLPGQEQIIVDFVERHTK